MRGSSRGRLRGHPALACNAIFSYCPSGFSPLLVLLSVRRLHSSGFRGRNFLPLQYITTPIPPLFLLSVRLQSAPVLTICPASVRPSSYCPSGFNPPLFLLSVRFQGRLHEYANMPSLFLSSPLFSRAVLQMSRAWLSVYWV